MRCDSMLDEKNEKLRNVGRETMRLFYADVCDAMVCDFEARERSLRARPIELSDWLVG